MSIYAEGFAMMKENLKREDVERCGRICSNAGGMYSNAGGCEVRSHDYREYAVRRRVYNEIRVLCSQVQRVCS